MSNAQHIYIELFNYKDSWLNLPQEVRDSFAEGVSQAVAGLVDKGVSVIGYGFNDVSTDRRAPYDFFCVYALPDAGFARAFEKEVAASGWYDFFEQANVSGAAMTAAAGLRVNAELGRPAAGS